MRGCGIVRRKMADVVRKDMAMWLSGRCEINLSQLTLKYSSSAEAEYLKAAIQQRDALCQRLKASV